MADPEVVAAETPLDDKAPEAAAVEQPPVEAAKEATPIPPEPDPQIKWRDRRIADLTATKNTLALRLDEMERKLASMAPPAEQAQQQQQAEVERRAQALATHYAAQADFNSRCNAVAEAGGQAHQDFSQAIAALNQVSGGAMPSSLVEAALETGNAHEVLYALGKDPNKAMEILGMTPERMAVKVAKLGMELGTRSKTSGAPPPIKPVVSGRGGEAVSIDLADTRGVSMDAWIRQREKELADRRKH